MFSKLLLSCSKSINRERRFLIINNFKRNVKWEVVGNWAEVWKESVLLTISTFTFLASKRFSRMQFLDSWLNFQFHFLIHFLFFLFWIIPFFNLIFYVLLWPFPISIHFYRGMDESMLIVSSLSYFMREKSAFENFLQHFFTLFCNGLWVIFTGVMLNFSSHFYFLCLNGKNYCLELHWR